MNLDRNFGKSENRAVRLWRIKFSFFLSTTSFARRDKLIGSVCFSVCLLTILRISDLYKLPNMAHFPCTFATFGFSSMGKHLGKVPYLSILIYGFQALGRTPINNTAGHQILNEKRLGLSRKKQRKKGPRVNRFVFKCGPDCRPPFLFACTFF